MDWVAKWGEWLRWGLVIALACIYPFLDRRYVPISEYRRDRDLEQANFESLKDGLRSVQTSIALLDAQSKIVVDHEARIRALEMRPRAAYDPTLFRGVGVNLFSEAIK